MVHQHHQHRLRSGNRKINMTSNSAIFTTTVFGNSSAMTAKELAENNRQTQEKFLLQRSSSNLGTKMPAVPTNQGIAKEK